MASLASKLELPEELRIIFEKSEENEKNRRINLPKALEIQKRRLQCAIGKAEPSPTADKDEDYLKKYFQKESDVFPFLDDFRNYESLLWKDTIATETVSKILKEHQKFDLSLYLDCAKMIYLTYSGKIMKTEDFYKALTYVITHARLFGDPSKHFFQLESNGSFEIEFMDISMPLSDNIYMREITALINALQTGYNETKYQILNTNVTYISLMVLRRFVKNDSELMDAFKRINTHDDYVRLCPHPLNNQLPRVNEQFNKDINIRLLKPSVLLAIHAFITGNDAITKRVLRATCLQYIEWTGLQLPRLFFQVVSLYEMEEVELWDSLSFDRTYKSLFKLADDYYKQYKMSKADPPETVAWFPYCRALNGDYHRDLSASENKGVCMILAYLVDLKKGFDHSFVRNSHWVKRGVNPSSECLKIAKGIHTKYSKPHLELQYSNMKLQ